MDAKGLHAMNTPMDFEQLVILCQRTHEELCIRAVRMVDAHLVVRNWLFGHYITEFEQMGADRAQYGARLLGSLADRLKPLKIKGTSVTRLKLYRSFYRLFPIGPTLSDQLEQLLPRPIEKSPTPSDLLPPEGFQIERTLTGALLKNFTLGWSLYVELLTIDSQEERRFYEIEAAANQWTVRELQRQINSSLYPSGAKSYNKGKPIRIEEFEAERAWWDKREENERAWRVSIDTIKAGNFNLDLKNPHDPDTGPGDIDHLLPEYEKLLAQIAETREALKNELAKRFWGK